MNDSVKIVFFGMRGVGSGPALNALLSYGYQVSAVVIPGPPGLRTLPPRLRQPSIVPMAASADRVGEAFVDDLARMAGAPVVLVGGLRQSEVVAAIEALEPDLIVASCFPWRVPPAILGLPRWGCLNVHPSLLPAGRGPDPVSEAFQRGETMTGVTIHLMDEGFDTGPIVVQEAVPIPPGIRQESFERELAAVGARLLIVAIEGLTSGRLTPIPQEVWTRDKGGMSP